MSWKGAEEILFQDASAYFSEEEWKLLQEWQKDLYRNVMKEIHQALISLGPLIAATVCTLRAKDKHEPQPLAEEPVERAHEMNHWPRFPSLDPAVPLKKEESVSIFIDHLGAEIGDSRSGHTSRASSGFSGEAYEVVSVCIKDETETYCLDSQDSKRKEPIGEPLAGNESMERKKKSGGHLKSSRKSTLCTSFPGKISTVVRQRSDEEVNSRSQLWPDCYRQRQEESAAQCGSSFSNPLHFALQQGSLEPGGPENFNAFQNNHRKPQFPNVLESTPHYQRTNSSTDSNGNNSLSEKFPSRPFRTNSRERPYSCTECGKSFFQKSCLVTHYRIHSSEKPYICTFCPKRFNRKDYLDGHIRIHTGERPYKCTKCDKSFVWKSHLNNHQKKHT